MNPKLGVFRLFSEMGYGQELLKTYERLIGEPPVTQRVSVDKKIQEFQLSQSEREGYVLFPLIPGYATLCRRFAVIGHAFQSEGYEPLILWDDDDLLIPPEVTVETDQSWMATEFCRYRAQKYPELFGFIEHSIGELSEGKSEISEIETTDLAELQSFKYNDIDIGRCATASTRKYLKEYTIDLTEPQTNDIFKQFLQSGILLVNATQKLLNNYNIKLAVVNEANYIQGNIPMQVCDDSEVTVYTQSKGYHSDSIIFGKSGNPHHMPQFGNNDLVKDAINTKLSEQEYDHIQSIFEERKEGSVTRVQYTPDSQLSIDSDKDHLVGIFSHLLWDGALEPEQALYNNIYHWIDETLSVAAQMKDIHFVIKAHPAEQIRGTNESTGDWVRENYAPLPENISLLPPDTDVNTYALIDDLDAGVVYASTVGLEIALEGKPVLAGGYPPYHGYDISHDPSTKSEYVEQLQNIGQLGSNVERTARAYRFAHFLFICKHFDFSYMSKSNGTIQFTHDEIAGENGVYTTIVEQMLNEEEVIRPSCWKLK